MFITIGIIALILSLGLVSLIATDEKILQHELVTAQLTTNSSASASNGTTGPISSFDADGTISSLAADTLIGSNTTLGTHTGDLWLLGGNWSFAVDNGNLSDFNADIVMTRHDGSGRHMHSIGMITNATGAIPPITDSTIALANKNYTSFMGNANITTGDEIKYRDVPLVIYLNNGNALNINPDPIKTEHHFKGLPIFGTVSSITDESGRQLRGES